MPSPIAERLRMPTRAATAAVVLAAAVLLAGSAPAGAVNGGEPAPGGSGGGDVDPSMSLTAPSTGFLGKAVRVTGRAPDAGGSRITIESSSGGGAWAPVAATTAASDGSFHAAWSPRTPGHYALRAVVEDSGAGTSRSDGEAHVSTPAAVSVYRPARATWYGPGFYGTRTACGQRLTPRTRGVAHRTLPCGTRVELAYRGRSIVVTVIDRGPYANGADWDLTAATARALGMSSTSRIGAMRVTPGR